MAMQQLEIATGFYTSDSLPLCAQRCINWIPVIPQASSLNGRALFDAPGITLFSSLVGVNRGAQEMNEVPYFVNGNLLYSVNSNGVAVSHGEVEGSGRVSLANNGQYLVVVIPGGKAYAYDRIGNTIAEITDVDFTARKANNVVQKDGYFVFASADGKVFFNSALNDPFTFDGLDIGTAEINPDKIVALHVNHNELFVCGLVSIEPFQNIGGSGFPFQRIPGADIQKGVHAKFSLVDFDNSFVFVGGGYNELSAIWKIQGSSTSIKISTSAIDNAIQEFTRAEIEKSFSWVYSMDGSFFVGFTFESDRIASKTFVYDATASALSGSSVWHERQTGVTDNRWRVNSIVSSYGKLLVADYINGNIGFIDKKSYTEYGEVMVQEKASKPFSAGGLPSFVGTIQLTMESGVGLAVGQGSDPIVRMDYSDDGGRTFSSEFSRSYGKVGEYMSLPTWRRQGRIPRHRVIRFKTSDPVKSVIIKLEADVELGA